MNILSIIGLASSLMQMSNSPAIQKLLSGGIGAITPASVSSALKDIEPQLTELGASLYPGAATAIHAVIGATSALLNGKLAEAAQAALNLYLQNVPGFVPLVVDGKFGPKSLNAVIVAQTKAGIKVDGWFGKATAAAIGLVL